MIFKSDFARLLTVGLIFYCSVGVCTPSEKGLVVGSPKLPTTVVFSVRPLEKVVFEAGPDQTLTGNVVLAVGKMSRPEVARAAGRAIAKKMFISGLRRIYEVAVGDELVLEGLSVGRESFEEGVYGGCYTIPLAGIKAQKPAQSVASESVELVKSGNRPSERRAEHYPGAKPGGVRKPNWDVDPKILEAANLKLNPSALLRADEKLQHEFECCSLAVDGVLSLMRSESKFSYETAALDLKSLAESFKSKVNEEILFTKQEKLVFSERIDALVENGFKAIVDLIR
jgi:hypothetical protein